MGRCLLLLPSSAYPGVQCPKEAEFSDAIHTLSVKCRREMCRADGHELLSPNPYTAEALNPDIGNRGGQNGKHTGCLHAGRPQKAKVPCWRLDAAFRVQGLPLKPSMLNQSEA